MKLKIIDNKEYIFDVVRKKYILNQPEEWVRQNIIEYLIKKKGYPASLISIEKKLEKSLKRSDIICYNRKQEPLLLIECKSYNTQLDESTFHQSMNYQKTINSKYIVITNGKQHYCFQLIDEKIVFAKKIPTYNELTNT